MRREQLILPPLTAFEVTIFRNEPLPYPAIYKVHMLFELQDKFVSLFNYLKLLYIFSNARCNISFFEQNLLHYA